MNRVEGGRAPSGRKHFAGSQLPLHRLLETQFTARRDDGQVIVHVVADEVADALEAVILCPNLGVHRERVKAGEDLRPQPPRLRKLENSRGLRKEKRTAGPRGPDR